ncbi:MAG: DUF6172 family protein [Acidovorax sp.]|uniref:DUF6172 family protein n=1 Tax=Acidovorax sp. TaxID=1872122 RepID=UPI0025C5F5E4|nr:DUF6172 family protein [Acidovorax sp.]MDH4427974.1 DUF6172 family protein [Acidovorax sp.]
MRKIFPLRIEGKNPDRILDAVKNEIRKYIRRERRRDLPEGADFWDFDCRFGSTREDAQVAHLAQLTGLINAVAAEGGTQLYVEILAKPGKRQPRPAGERDAAAGDAADLGDDEIA